MKNCMKCDRHFEGLTDLCPECGGVEPEASEKKETKKRGK